MIRSDLKNKFKNIEKVRGAMIFEFFSPGIPLVLKILAVNLLFLIWNMVECH